MMEPFCSNPKCQYHTTLVFPEEKQLTVEDFSKPHRLNISLFGTKTLHREEFTALHARAAAQTIHFCPTCGEAARMTASMMRGRP